MDSGRTGGGTPPLEARNQPKESAMAPAGQAICASHGFSFGVLRAESFPPRQRSVGRLWI